jgi:uncharacterized membrane protein
LSSFSLNTTAYSFSLSKLLFFRTAVFLFLSFWCAGFLFPLASGYINNVLADIFFVQLYSTVCHQQSEKCLSIAGSQLLVCARCTGIYLGALVTAFVIISFKSIKTSSTFLLISLLLLIADVLFVLTNVYPYSKITAMSTGLIFGVSIYLYLMKELENFFFTEKK